MFCDADKAAPPSGVQSGQNMFFALDLVGRFDTGIAGDEVVALMREALGQSGLDWA